MLPLNDCRWVRATWTVFARNRDSAVPAEGNGDLQTLICVLVARPRRCLTSSNPVPWQNWMAAYLGYTLRMRMLFRGWVIVNDTYTRRRRVDILNTFCHDVMVQCAHFVMTSWFNVLSYCWINFWISGNYCLTVLFIVKLLPVWSVLPGMGITQVRWKTIVGRLIVVSFITKTLMSTHGGFICG